ncbi:NADPH-dependent F420 reductase [Serratia sp. (in: enterobacteria)]|uniref:NADPH-dependent F420 reductase n=1 Tax=Serratia sp. (in: enterobacteria) TaxID=616 RepID=UPI003989D414
MKIGIIGAGFIARSLAEHALANGHQVMLSNSRGPETLYSLKVALACETGTVQQAVEFGDIVVIAITFKHYATVPAEALRGKIVIDTNNYYPERDGNFVELDQQLTTTSEMLAHHLYASHVVKAFNSIRVIDLNKDGRPQGDERRRALPIVGDSEDAKKRVSDLIDQFGFDVVDAGALKEGWRFQRGSPLYCEWFNQSQLKKSLADLTREQVIA